MKFLKISIFIFFAFCQAFFAVGKAHNLSTTLAFARYGHLFKNQSFLAFPEFRENPIRWHDSIPETKLKEIGLKNTFPLNANPGEFFVFQIGIWAIHNQARDVQIKYSILKDKNGTAIPVSRMTCFNEGGVDFMGKPFSKAVNVPAGQVQALWVGIDLDSVQGGNYGGSFTLVSGGKKQLIPVLLKVSGEPVPNHGVNEGSRLSRLSWLNSTVGIDNRITKGYLPVEVSGNKIGILGRSLKISANGLPSSILSYFSPSNQSLASRGEPIVDQPFRFVIEKEDGTVVQLVPGKLTFREKIPLKVVWSVMNHSDEFDLECIGTMEFDGFVDYHLILIAKRSVKIKDIRLEIPVTRDKATYMMGLNKPGGLRPGRWDWKWDITKNQDDLWLGAVNGGLRIKWKAENYVLPLVNVYYSFGELHLPPSWGNSGKGGVKVSEIKNEVLVNGYSGSREMKAGEQLRYDFELLITPFKTINKSVQYGTRYYHSGKNVSTDYIHAADSLGANSIIVHQGNDIYPFINYPYSDINLEALKNFIHEAHQDHKRVKVYYTTRELTVNLPELWPFLSLNGEVIFPGPGAAAKTLTNPDGPDPWLKENLRGRKYIPAWVAHFTQGKYAGIQDLSVITTPDSRLNNFYVAGLNWMVNQIRIDGIYIDDCSLDRYTIRRARKILDDHLEDANIDMHSWNHFNKYAGWASCLNLYMDLFPYIDQLWIGEARNYDTPPDYWLVEISGLPFGVPSQMLQDGGNPWRGMVYGMTNRAGWIGSSPDHIWSFWDKYDLKDKTMVGYWEKDCPVTCSNPMVKASVYQGADETIISVANWSDHDQAESLTTDWAKLGIDPAHVAVFMPEIKDFQSGQTTVSLNNLTLPGKKGFLIILKPVSCR